MKKESVLTFIHIVLICIGTYILLKSTSLGLDAANEYVRDSGGSINANEYLSIVESYTNSYRLMGAIIFGVSLFSLLRRK
jgi:hypothetical protein